jgi:hypothetical protein
VITDEPAMAPFQAQAPLWAPGTTPRLVHEATDRDQRTTLRVVSWVAATPDVQWVPGTRSTRAEALGATGPQADIGASWWDNRSFFFRRATGAGGRLMVWDGAPREVSTTIPPVLDVVADPSRGLLASLDAAGGPELFDLGSPSAMLPSPRRLTRNRGEVEHSAIRLADDLFACVATRREGARILTVRPGVVDSGREPPGQAALQGHEVLAISPVPGTDAVVALTRLHPPLLPAGSAPTHAVIEVGALRDGPVTVRQVLRGVHVPSGLAPRPAVSVDGRFVFVISDDPARGNPVLRVERSTGRAEVLQLGLRGAQEISVAEYPGSDGKPRTWIAVVAVGDVRGDDVRNHIYAGPLP